MQGEGRWCGVVGPREDQRGDGWVVSVAPAAVRGKPKRTADAWEREREREGGTSGGEGHPTHPTIQPSSAVSQ